MNAQTAADLVKLSIAALEAACKIVKVVKDGLDEKVTPAAVKAAVAKLISDLAATDATIDAKLRAKFARDDG
jgi:hypothetical protein